MSLPVNTHRPAVELTREFYATHSEGQGGFYISLSSGVEVEDTVNVLTRHGSIMGCFSLNQHQAHYETILTVVCERGMARFEAHHSRWRWVVEPGGDWQEEPWAPLQRDTLFERQA